VATNDEVVVVTTGPVERAAYLVGGAPLLGELAPTVLDPAHGLGCGLAGEFDLGTLLGGKLIVRLDAVELAQLCQLLHIHGNLEGHALLLGDVDHHERAGPSELGGVLAPLDDVGEGLTLRVVGLLSGGWLGRLDGGLRGCRGLRSELLLELLDAGQGCPLVLEAILRGLVRFLFVVLRVPLMVFQPQVGILPLAARVVERTDEGEGDDAEGDGLPVHAVLLVAADVEGRGRGGRLLVGHVRSPFF